MRIASLLPSSTEIVCALGFEAALVARSHECDYPASVRALPPVTAPKFDPDGRSYEIDQRVKAILQEATSVYRIDADLLKTLEPDLIITQMQCEVCAVSFAEVERVACEFLDVPAQIIALEPNNLADVLADVQRVADALGAPERGQALVAAMQQRMTSIHERASALPKPSVATIEWIDPLMSAGNWMPELVEMAGGYNLFGQAGTHSPWLSWDELAQADPDLILILPCGYDMATTERELPALTQRDGWEALRAVQQGRVFVADGNQYFNRPGPRLVESLEILAEILHPEAFSFGHEGTGWRKFQPVRVG
ncbi:MAG: cobalamin-binding protein [Anaerolineae bacterium]|nr:cobalamin-binding protein [Anaerolineae bacterium]MDW8173629.1 cobalamin-binding protein [Anaerolineae bacterium]